MFNLWVASVDETAGPMRARLEDPDDVLAQTVDQTVASDQFKKYNGMTVFSYYGESNKAPAVREVLDGLLADPENAGKIIALGMWKVQDGSEWGVGGPWYPQPAELLNFMPDIITIMPGAEPVLTPRTRPVDVNRVFGQAPRWFALGGSQPASAQGLLDFLIGEGWDAGLVDDTFIVSMHVDPAPPGGTVLNLTFEFTFGEAYSDAFIEHPPGPLLNDIMDYFRLHAH